MDLAAASASIWSVAERSVGRSSEIPCAPRARAISRTLSSEETTHVSQPSTARVASIDVFEHRQGERTPLERSEERGQPGLRVAQ